MWSHTAFGALSMWGLLSVSDSQRVARNQHFSDQRTSAIGSGSSHWETHEDSNQERNRMLSDLVSLIVVVFSFLVYGETKAWSVRARKDCWEDQFWSMAGSSVCCFLSRVLEYWIWGLLFGKCDRDPPQGTDGGLRSPLSALQLHSSQRQGVVPSMLSFPQSIPSYLLDWLLFWWNFQLEFVTT